MRAAPRTRARSLTAAYVSSRVSRSAHTATPVGRTRWKRLPARRGRARGAGQTGTAAIARTADGQTTAEGRRAVDEWRRADGRRIVESLKIDDGLKIDDVRRTVDG